jgi:hypothetical protein
MQPQCRARPGREARARGSHPVDVQTPGGLSRRACDAGRLSVPPRKRRHASGGAVQPASRFLGRRGSLRAASVDGGCVPGRAAAATSAARAGSGGESPGLFSCSHAHAQIHVHVPAHVHVHVHRPAGGPLSVDADAVDGQSPRLRRPAAVRCLGCRDDNSRPAAAGNARRFHVLVLHPQLCRGGALGRGAQRERGSRRRACVCRSTRDAENVYRRPRLRRGPVHTGRRRRRLAGAGRARRPHAVARCGVRLRQAAIQSLERLRAALVHAPQAPADCERGGVHALCVFVH